MSSLIRNLGFAFALAFIVWLGYTLFIKESDDVVSTEGKSQAALEGQEFLAHLQKVKKINLQSEVLNDARFESLIDLSIDVVPEPKGRENPFTPVTKTPVKRVN